MSREATIYVVGAVAMVLLFVIFFPHRHGYAPAPTRAIVIHTLGGAGLYYLEHGRFPTGTAQIATLPTFKDFFTLRPKWTNTYGAILDQWGQPLILRLVEGGEAIQIYSLGPNGIDDGGTNGPIGNGRVGDDLMREISAGEIMTKVRLWPVLDAAEDYRHKHGSFPTTTVGLFESESLRRRFPRWTEWVSADGHVVDAWGQPLRIQVYNEGKSVRVYLIGANGIDEGGRNGPDGKGGYCDDWMVQ